MLFLLHTYRHSTALSPLQQAAQSQRVAKKIHTAKQAQRYNLSKLSHHGRLIPSVVPKETLHTAWYVKTTTAHAQVVWSEKQNLVLLKENQHISRLLCTRLYEARFSKQLSYIELHEQNKKMHTHWNAKFCHSGKDSTHSCRPQCTRPKPLQQAA